MHEPRSEIHAGDAAGARVSPPSGDNADKFAGMARILRASGNNRRDEDAPEFPTIIGETASTPGFYGSHPPRHEQRAVLQSTVAANDLTAMISHQPPRGIAPRITFASPFTAFYFPQPGVALEETSRVCAT